MSDTRTGLFASTAAKVVAVVASLCALSVGGVIGIVTHQPVGTKVVLEPINKVAEDSAWISGGLDLTDDEEQIGAEYADYSAGQEIPDPREQQVTSTLAGSTVSGSDAGVYGGTRDTLVCNKEVLIAFFADASNGAARTAWAGVLGMQPEQVENYLTGLTGARLRWDTRLTDTGYRDSKLLTWQALVQAGTAVLVDNTGVPRVKCNSGSPLLSPQGLKKTDKEDLSLSQVAENPDDAWDGLDTQDVVAIQPGKDPLQSLTIVDVSTDELLTRDVGSDGASSRDVGSGDVQFTVKWNSRADLDIHVTDPDGYTYGVGEDYYVRTEDDGTVVSDVSDNDGRLDVDSNIGCKDQRDESGFAKENVFWPPGAAPAGTYTVYIDGFSDSVESCGQSGSFTLTATIGGKVQTLTGVVTEDRNSQTWTFTKPE